MFKRKYGYQRIFEFEVIHIIKRLWCSLMIAFAVLIIAA